MLFTAVLLSASVSFANVVTIDPTQGASVALGQPGELNAQAVAWPGPNPLLQPSVPQMPTHIYNSDGSSATIIQNPLGGATMYGSNGQTSTYMPNPLGGGSVYNSDGSTSTVY
jgi:hypothetical protein